MRTLPPEPKPGDRISATLLREIIRAIRERTIIRGPGINTATGPNGTVVSAKSSSRSEKSHQVLPWTFSCSVDPDTGERTGGWKNCSYQLGTSMYTDESVSDRDRTEDGRYYCEFDTAEGTGEIKSVGLSSEIPEHDLENGKVNIYIGKVEEAKQTDRIMYIPIVYTYL